MTNCFPAVDHCAIPPLAHCSPRREAGEAKKALGELEQRNLALQQGEQQLKARLAEAQGAAQQVGTGKSQGNTNDFWCLPAEGAG